MANIAVYQNENKRGRGISSRENSVDVFNVLLERPIWVPVETKQLETSVTKNLTLIWLKFLSTICCRYYYIIDVEIMVRG